jgi:hypothetical protein
MHRCAEGRGTAGYADLGFRDRDGPVRPGVCVSSKNRCGLTCQRRGEAHLLRSRCEALSALCEAEVDREFAHVNGHGQGFAGALEAQVTCGSHPIALIVLESCIVFPPLDDVGEPAHVGGLEIGHGVLVLRPFAENKINGAFCCANGAEICASHRSVPKKFQHASNP